MRPLQPFARQKTAYWKTIEGMPYKKGRTSFKHSVKIIIFAKAKVMRAKYIKNLI